MSKFTQGFTTGVAACVGIAAGVWLSFKKTVVQPIEEQESKIDENRKKANRKSHSAHLS
ncbi:DUF3042 family protein [Fructilactobacillus fructivorans]|uniref:DUF3042 family protein n=1 Tax=Fructilactobacillus fructivorans TaxID=1614 RepID=A0A0C1PQG6_9LACO|nr:DUF3042 family protein [Fructilactobacillus fructivorans]KID42136.1 hypothetical protein LfDm3_0541 [Fructilactobacillus fructivorans]KRK58576.1 hypothetical protein FC73_GL000131 [Fructilactobacillus fructivorans]KRN13421.1 hypothetical protein IV37_GL000138 [Fructilactobacillus fructivorans]KRN40129.1 hypothetical protein IV51_GL000311 [Fructilactobacillus fructivorans]KRN43539.1 hypothetical protein IV48_GL000144 [Fructilactobacillus fructivorans]